MRNNSLRWKRVEGRPFGFCRMGEGKGGRGGFGKGFGGEGGKGGKGGKGKGKGKGGKGGKGGKVRAIQTSRLANRPSSGCVCYHRTIRRSGSR